MEVLQAIYLNQLEYPWVYLSLLETSRRSSWDDKLLLLLRKFAPRFFVIAVFSVYLGVRRTFNYAFSFTGKWGRKSELWSFGKDFESLINFLFYSRYEVKRVGRVFFMWAGINFMQLSKFSTKISFREVIEFNFSNTSKIMILIEFLYFLFY